MDCHVCKLPDANIPDPCCNAPDCEHKGDYVHMHCLPPARQRQERKWEIEDDENWWGE